MIKYFVGFSLIEKMTIINAKNKVQIQVIVNIVKRKFSGRSVGTLVLYNIIK